MPAAAPLCDQLIHLYLLLPYEKRTNGLDTCVCLFLASSYCGISGCLFCFSLQMIPRTVSFLQVFIFSKKMCHGLEFNMAPEVHVSKVCPHGHNAERQQNFLKVGPRGRSLGCWVCVLEGVCASWSFPFLLPSCQEVHILFPMDIILHHHQTDNGLSNYRLARSLFSFCSFDTA